MTVLIASSLTAVLGANAADALATRLELPAGYADMLRLTGSFTASLGLLGALWVVQRALHHRSLRSLVTAGDRVSTARLLAGAGVWTVLLLVTEGLAMLVEPGAYRLTLQPGLLALSLVSVVPLVALQALGEELLFRGYLMQALGRWMRDPLALVAAGAILFAVTHAGNPEVLAGGWTAIIPYALMGAFLTAVAVRDGRLELAIGAHVANNLTAALVVGSTGSVLAGTAPLLTTAASTPLVTLGVLAVQAVLFWLAVFRLPLRPRHAAPDADGRPAT